MSLEYIFVFVDFEFKQNGYWKPMIDIKHVRSIQ